MNGASRCNSRVLLSKSVSLSVEIANIMPVSMLRSFFTGTDINPVAPIMLNGRPAMTDDASALAMGCVCDHENVVPLWHIVLSVDSTTIYLFALGNFWHNATTWQCVIAAMSSSRFDKSL